MTNRNNKLILFCCFIYGIFQFDMLLNQYSIYVKNKKEFMVVAKLLALYKPHKLHPFPFIQTLNTSFIYPLSSYYTF